jgi:tricorn protease
MRKIALLYIASLVSVFSFAAEPPLLLQSPSLSQSEIAFAYAGSIWTVPRDGGSARRIVASDPGWAAHPHFSPDGKWIAFTGSFDGNQDVYVVPAGGGELKRLTMHPGSDVAVGWTPDGARVLFRSTRETYSRFERLLTVGLEGGLPEPLPLPMGVQGSFAADGKQVAYVPRWNRRLGAVDSYMPIKHYKGGLTSPIWIAQLSDSSVTPLPRENSSDFNPMWIGDKVYFLSDRAGAISLFSYDVKSRAVKQVVKNDGFDFKSASAGPGAIVYERFGSLHLYDLASGKEKAVDVRVAADLPQARVHFAKVTVRGVPALSPSGLRALFEARGEILSVPGEKGDVRNLTRSPGVADRSPAWSPDGRTIAYFSDESGEYALHLRDQTGLGEVKKLALGTPPSFFSDPVWSPDSRKIAYRDKRLNLWYVDVAKGEPVKVDTDLFDNPSHRFDVTWSPDSRWLTYTKLLRSNLHAVFVYSLENSKATQITDGLSDALYPAFDRGGKYLYFTASTDVALAAGWLDMSSRARPVTRNAYLAVLKKGLPSPLAPESDEEKAEEAEKEKEKAPGETPQARLAAADDPKPSEEARKAKAEAAGDEPEKPADGKATAKSKEPAKVEIDFDGLSQRILTLPVPARNYRGLTAGKEGIVYLLEGPQVEMPIPGEDGPPPAALQRFDLKTRKTEKLIDGVTRFVLAAKGEKMLWSAARKWHIAAADKAPKPGEGALKTDEIEIQVDPRAEWRQMYREVWRIQRDFFYDPNFHGLDLARAERTYAPFLEGIGSRADLNYLFDEMLGQLNVQHMYVSGGAKPEVKVVAVGLLGANYTIDGGRYRFARIYNGENWNPTLQAPLTQPGVNVKAGEYLLAVNGRELRASDEVYALFAGTVGKQTVLRVGPSADGKDARDVTVVPIANETGLRNRAWIEDNRRKVDEMSRGRLAYVYLPDTATGGFTQFNRYYFAQVGREGAVLDERFNGGGQLADYIVDYLRRPLLSYNLSREGEIARSPAGSIYGPSVMLMNEFSASGGDAMPWYFRKLKIGPLVGMRTWGGLVGIGLYPPLLDGGNVTAPRWALFGTEGQWEVENVGIAPDIEIDLDPKLVRQGRDPQLEKAVEVAMGLLEKNPPKKPVVPPFPKYTPRWPTSAR